MRHYTQINLGVIGFVLLFGGGNASVRYIWNLKRWKKELTDRYNELKLIFANSLDGILLLDNNGTIVKSNPSADRLLSPDDSRDVTGDNLSDVLDFGNPAMRKFVRKTWKQKYFNGTYPLQLRNDTSFFAEISSSAVKNEEGKTLHCVIFKDATETVEHLNKIHESERTYRDLLTSIQDGILLANKEGVVIRVNPAALRMFGYTEDEMIGLTPYDIIAPESQELISSRELIQKAFAGKIQIFDRWAVRKDGTTFPVELTLSKGKFFGEDIIVGVIHDITDREKHIKQLQQANDENRILLQEVHHRVKNNMALISGLLYLQAYDLEDPEVQSILFRSQERIQTIAQVHEYLYKSKSLNRIDFNAYLNTWVVECYKCKAENDAPEIQIYAPHFDLNINQAQPLALLLNELVMNVVEHKSTKGNAHVIKIVINIDGDRVQIGIRDNGKPMTDFEQTELAPFGIKLMDTLTQQLEATLESIQDREHYYMLTFTREQNIRGSGSGFVS